MAIQRWDPMRDMLQLREQVNRLFEETLARSATDGSDRQATAGWRPPLDLYEEQDRYVVRADLPGVTAADVDLQIDRGRLLLSGERRPEDGLDREAFLRVERPHGRFAAQVALPSSVDQQGIQAQYRNGVLEIVLPKRAADGTARIRVQGGG